MGKENYSILLFFVEDKETNYWMAVHPEFNSGLACNAVGDSIVDAINLLNIVRADVLNYYRQENKDIPEPFVNPLEKFSQSLDIAMRNLKKESEPDTCLWAVLPDGGYMSECAKGIEYAFDKVLDDFFYGMTKGTFDNFNHCPFCGKKIER